MKKLDLLFNLRWPLLIFSFAALAFLLPHAAGLPVDPSNHAIFQRNDDYRINEKFQEIFGSDDTVILAVSVPSVKKAEVMDWIRTLTDEISGFPEVESVQTLVNLPRIDRHLFSADVEEAAAKYFQGEESLEEFFTTLESYGAYAGRLVNPSHNFFANVVYLKGGLASGQRHQVIEGLRQWAAEHPLDGAGFYFSGTAVEQDSFIARLQHDHHTFVPLTFLIILGLAFLLNGGLFAVFYPAAVIGAALISTQALMAFLNQPLNMLTTLVAPVILTVSVADVLHVQSYVQHVQGYDHSRDSFRRVFTGLAEPCLLTTLTTMAGFLSLLSNAIPAVRQFGMFGAAGSGLALLWTVIFAPVFLSLHFRTDNCRASRLWQRIENGLAQFSSTRHVLIYLFVLVCTVTGAAGIRNIQTETDILRTFKPEDAFRRDTYRIQEELGGIYTLELILDSGSPERFRSPNDLAKAVRFKESVETLGGVSSVYYITDLLEMIDREVRKGGIRPAGEIDAENLSRYLDGMLEEGGPNLERIEHDHFRQTRMSVFTRHSSTAELAALADKIRALADSLLPAEWRVQITGQSYLLARMSQDLVKNEVKSILIALIAVCVLIGLWLRSLTFAVTSLFVNLIPLISVMGLMPRLGISLNTATAMTGALAVGLIVDNSIHVLYRFREKSPASSGIQDLLAHVMRYCAKPLASTMLILSAGFSVTLFGSIQPTVEFGTLMVLIIIAAFTVNLFFLPVFLMLFYRRRL